MKIRVKILAAIAFVALATAWLWGRLSVPSPGGRNISDGTEGASRSETAVVTKVIDGDTIVVSGGDHVRLLGIDADEKDHPCYDAARLRLEDLVLGKTVILESDSQDTDQYGRKLRYIFWEGININEKLVAEGMAVARFYSENQKYKNEVTAAEAAAMKNKTGCKWSGNPQRSVAGDDSGVVLGNYEWKKIIGDSIEPCLAKEYIGKETIIEGMVVETYRSNSDTVFLDLGAKYPNNCFTAVIFKSDLANFPANPENIYKGRGVRIKGIVKEYEGKPEIILQNDFQIEVAVNN